MIHADAALQASMAAMEQVYGHLRAVGHLGGAQDRLMSFAARQAAVGFDGWRELAQR